eukprot:2302412-Alexandrium_andersonii.AAC.1
MSRRTALRAGVGAGTHTRSYLEVSWTNIRRALSTALIRKSSGRKLHSGPEARLGASRNSRANP